MKNNIKLIALDIDGVLSKGMRSTFNYSILNILAKMNIRASKDQKYPAVTLITGRPQPYVEALMQVIKGFVPAVFEQGTGFYDPADYITGRNPELKNTEAFFKMKNKILTEIMQENKEIEMQPGKENTISLYSKDKTLHSKLKDIILEKDPEWINYFDFIYSLNCLNIIPKGFHKGKGIDLLSEKAGIDIKNILGVGDSDVDVPFLEKTGYSAAPANASETVKKAADYTASKNYDEGLYEILDHYSLIP